jgi:hypothetical protein
VTLAAPGHSSLETMTEQGYTLRDTSFYPSNSIVFNAPPTKEIARFTEEGFYYKGEFVDDAGEVHRLLKDVLNGICYKQLCIDLINNAHAGKSGQMGWTSEAEDQLLKRAAEACGPDCFAPTTWNILTQTV